MTIQGLWTLLDVVGRQVDISSLHSKTLAVDASIWLVQFVKAMRDSEGQMIPNAHLLGTFRRVAHLLSCHIKPVFVFDGPSRPALKQTTLARRRARKDTQVINLKQTAQRLLTNQLKQHAMGSKNKQPPTANAEEEEEKKEEKYESLSSSSEDEEDDNIISNDDNLISEQLSSFIQKVQRQNRNDSRTSLIPLAGKPEEYSKTQIQNFLKTCRLNQEIKKSCKNNNEIANDSAFDNSHRIASDSTRRYVLTHSSNNSKNANIMRENEDDKEEEEDLLEEEESHEIISRKRKGDEMEEEEVERVLKASKKEEEDENSRVSLNDEKMKKDSNRTSDDHNDMVTISFKASDIRNPNELFDSSIFNSDNSSDNSSDDDDDIEWESVTNEINDDTNTITNTTPERVTISSEESKVFINDDDTTITDNKSIKEDVSEIIHSSASFNDTDEKKLLESINAQASLLPQWAGDRVKKTMNEYYNITTRDEKEEEKKEEKVQVAEEEKVPETESKKQEEATFEWQSREELVLEESRLRNLMRNSERDIDGITVEMTQDVMNLLNLLGVPYLVAPEEAEAQCATLEALNLVDGVITDDSDVFAFGAKSVYRHMFSSGVVTHYDAQYIKKELSYDRESIICLAMLLGSDYTDGVNGIGIVNAAEIMAKYSPTLQGLSEFQKQSTKWDFPRDFLSPSVVEAYLNPEVNTSTASFHWNTDDFDQEKIVWYCERTFKWSRSQAQDAIDSIITARNKKKCVQLSMDEFVSTKVATVHSKRLQKVLSKKN